MIRKFVTIQNVGKFRACKAAGDVELRGLSLIYAENGRGKTTLCDVLRSLRSGDGDYVRGRETLGPSSAPAIEIRLDGSTARFDGTTWSETLPELHVFDSRFVHDNVYAGELVEHEQKRNLYRVIVGEKGVDLARKVDSLDADIRDADKVIRDAKLPVAEFSPSPISADDFVALKKDPDVDSKIASKTTELESLRRAGEIEKKPLLRRLEPPTLPTNLPTILGKQLDDVSTGAETLVRQHRADHTIGATEPWLAQGIQFQKGEECPFCQQDVTASDLIAAYRGYFGASYTALKDELETLRQDVVSFGTEATGMVLRRTVEANNELLEFWRQFLALDDHGIDTDELLESMDTVRALALASVEAKAASILEPTVLGADYETASLRFEEAKSSVGTYNEAVTAANVLISAKKGETGAGDLAQAQSDLVFLHATKRRHESEPAAACQVYVDAQAKKKGLEKEKDDAKKLLDEHSGDLLATFQKRINQLLEMVTAGYRLTGIAREYKGRSPRSTYQVLINDVAVELGDEKTPASQPSFRNTLSAGDRSTLALAFFLAQLELDPELEKKVVVFDDPFTSQDLSRRTWTQQRICRIAVKAKQVIVLSHEPNFLRLIYEAVPSVSVKTLQFCRIGQEDTTITPWDILDATRGDYFKNHGVLTEFANDGKGDLRNVVRTIRPLLEGYFRFKFPGEFGENEWLGDFIEKIRNASPGTVLEAPQALLEELEDTNDYSKKYHHDKNPNADSEPISDGELRAFVRRTLEVVGGF